MPSYDYSASTRSYRASSAMPDSLHRLRYDVDPHVNRALSVAREIIETPLPSVKSTLFRDYYDTKDSLASVKEAIRKSDDYWLSRYSNSVLSGYEPRRYFPLSYYSSNYGYSSTLPPFYSYGRRFWPLNDYLTDNYLHDPYNAHWYSHRDTRRRYPDYSLYSYPYRSSLYSSYTPRYTPTVRRYYY